MKIPPFFMLSFVAFSLSAASAAETRSLNGSANNLANPDWGSVGSQFLRSMPSEYEDGVSAPSGSDRPDARTISNAISHQAESTPSAYGLSDYVWQWGQFIDHDITLSPGTGEFLPIPVATGDPLAPMIPMMRTGYDSNTGILTPRQQINMQSSFLDGSMIYGADAVRAAALRVGTGGMLMMSSQGMLPKNTAGLPNANDAHILPDDQLFLAGDVRANEQPGLTAMHTLFAREHNRLAGQVAQANPTWTDEEIYQKTRSLVSGEIQSITYNEFLPALMGGNAPTLWEASYNPSVNPTISNEFAGSLFRLGHSMVSPELLKVSDDGIVISSVDLGDAFFVSPMILDDPGDVDLFLKGLAVQVQQELDPMIVDPLRNRLFGAPGSGGLDLAALNIQRGRDHGFPDYNTMRQAYGLDPVQDFSDITSDIELAAALAGVYGHVDLIDSWVGALAEDHLPGSSIGALLTVAFDEEFSRLRDGDRFFFLNDENLTAEEKQWLANTALSDVIRYNTGITDIQDNVFFAHGGAVPEPSAALLVLIGGLCGLGRRRR